MSSDDYWSYQYMVALAALRRAEIMLGLQVSPNQLTLF
jgi:hypothetical protein